MKFQNEMTAVVDALGKKWAGIATRRNSIIDLLTMGFYPKPTYEQIGTFRGDVSGLNVGDKVKVVFKTKEQRSFLDKYTPFGTNIAKLEKVINL